MNKKVVALLLALLCVLALVACASSKTDNGNIPDIDELSNTRNVRPVQTVNVDSEGMPYEQEKGTTDIVLTAAVVFIGILVCTFAAKDYIEKRKDPLRRWIK